jgi:MOSC domain-containing protein YiiM
MESRESLRALEDRGLEGDRHGKNGGPRQVLLMDEETLAAFQLTPGRIRENITTRGIAVQSLAPGTRLRAGRAILEITKPCTPCEFIEQIRTGLRAAIEGQRGIFARVVASGEMEVGDPVEIETAG